jgi:hypothetical protein
MEVSSNNQVVKLMHENRAFAFWLRVSILLGLLNCLVLVVSGIGLLFLKPWARVLAIAYGVYAIVVGLFNIGINFAFVVRPLLQQAKTQNNTEAAGAAAGAIGGTIGGCIGLVYPLLVLIFMLLPKVAAAFRPATPPPLGA